VLRIDRSLDATESLVESAMREAGFRRIRRDSRGRLVGTKTRVTATGKVVVDLGVPASDDGTYVAAVGKYTTRSQVPSLLGRDTPKGAAAFRRRLRELAGDDLTPIEG